MVCKLLLPQQSNSITFGQTQLTWLAFLSDEPRFARDRSASPRDEPRADRDRARSRSPNGRLDERYVVS